MIHEFEDKKVTHAKSKDTYFQLINVSSNAFTWRCTHGSWSIECDKQGVVTKGWLKITGMKHLSTFELDTYFTYEEYMTEFGDKNPYE